MQNNPIVCFSNFFINFMETLKLYAYGMDTTVFLYNSVLYTVATKHYSVILHVNQSMVQTNLQHSIKKNYLGKI